MTNPPLCITEEQLAEGFEIIDRALEIADAAMEAEAGALPSAIGFIGLGIMGRPMARNLLAAGFPLTVHSRSPGPVDELVEAGAARADGPAEVAAASDIVDHDAARHARRGAGAVRPAACSRAPRGLARDRHELDRPGPDASAWPHAFAARRRRRCSTRRCQRRREGRDRRRRSRSWWAATPTAFDAREPMFEVLGHEHRPRRAERRRAGRARRATSWSWRATIEAVAEALLLAERSGVDAAKVREALLGGFAGSKILEVHGQRMLDRTFDPGFRIRLHRKDARIVEAAAAATGRRSRRSRSVVAAAAEASTPATASSTTAGCSPSWSEKPAADRRPGSRAAGARGPGAQAGVAAHRSAHLPSSSITFERSRPRSVSR